MSRRAKLRCPIDTTTPPPKPTPPELLPCPFCGNKPELYEWEPDPEMCTGFGSFKRHRVRCRICNALGPFTDRCFDDGFEASVLWNQRKP